MINRAYSFIEAKNYLNTHAAGGVLCVFGLKKYLAFCVSMAYDFFHNAIINYKNKITKGTK